MTGMKNPGALAGAAGAMATVQAALLNVTTTNSTIPGELHASVNNHPEPRSHPISAGAPANG